MGFTLLALTTLVTNICWLFAYSQVKDQNKWYADRYDRVEKAYGPFIFYNPDGLGRG